jgi:hypothetical protein
MSVSTGHAQLTLLIWPRFQITRLLIISPFSFELSNCKKGDPVGKPGGSLAQSAPAAILNAVATKCIDLQQKL